ncbi:hypothetical protein M3J09_006282 [Ascochyta lentis]
MIVAAAPVGPFSGLSHATCGLAANLHVAVPVHPLSWVPWPPPKPPSSSHMSQSYLGS